MVSYAGIHVVGMSCWWINTALILSNLVRGGGNCGDFGCSLGVVECIY